MKKHPSIDQLDKPEARYISASRRRRGLEVLYILYRKQSIRCHLVTYSQSILKDKLDVSVQPRRSKCGRTKAVTRLGFEESRGASIT